MLRTLTCASFGAIALLLLGYAGCKSSASDSSSSACTTLAPCCLNAGSSEQSCIMTVTNNDNGACEATLGLLTSAGTCGTSTGSGTGSPVNSACANLGYCCAQMPTSSASGCNGLVTAGVASNCATALSEYNSIGACNPTGPGSGTGVGPGSGTGTHPGSGTGSHPGSGTGVGPGSGTGVGPGSGTGVGPGSGTGTGPVDAGVDATLVACSVPGVAPSNGSCVTIVPQNDAGTGAWCNPVTNAGCPEAGTACDYTLDPSGTEYIGFQCYSSESVNTGPVCGACGSTNYCLGTETCYPPPYTTQTTGTCARYCCTDNDCGSGGHCATGGYAPGSSAVGVCLNQ